MRLEESHLEPVTTRVLLYWMLNNLRGIYIQRQEWTKALTILEWMLAVFPEEAGPVRDRGLVQAKLQQYAAALADLEDYLRRAPDAVDAEQIRETAAALAQWRARVN